MREGRVGGESWERGTQYSFRVWATAHQEPLSVRKGHLGRGGAHSEHGPHSVNVCCPKSALPWMLQPSGPTVSSTAMELESHLTALCLHWPSKPLLQLDGSLTELGYCLVGRPSGSLSLHIIQHSLGYCLGGSSCWQPGAPPVQVGRGLQWRHWPSEGALRNCTLGLAEI